MRTFQLGHYVGTYLRGHDGRPYLCVAYDPDSDYFVCTVDDEPARFANISTRAIGRTYHEDYDREPFGRPDVLVAVVALAYAKAKGERVTNSGLTDAIEDIPLIRDIYIAAKEQFAAWKAEHDEYYRKRAEENDARERAGRMQRDRPAGTTWPAWAIRRHLWELE